MNVFINWLPMIILIGIWVFFMWRLRGGPLTKYQADCYELTKRQVEALERIAVALERRG